jgi:hypothetical protein
MVGHCFGKVYINILRDEVRYKGFKKVEVALMMHEKPIDTFFFNLRTFAQSSFYTLYFPSLCFFSSHIFK